MGNWSVVMSAVCVHTLLYARRLWLIIDCKPQLTNFGRQFTILITTTCFSFQRSNSESSRSSSEKKQSSKVSCFPTLQPSQGDVITYDDPAGRLERERILAQLKAASPSQDGFTEFRSTELSDFPVEEMEEEDPAEV